MSLPEDFQLREFAPLCLSVERIGPFQNRLEEIDFTTIEGEPCNAFLLLSQNGRGKTTVLELIKALVALLGQDALSQFDYEPLNSGSGRAQLDLRVKSIVAGRTETAVLSLIAGDIGESTYLKPWLEEDLKRVGAEIWRQHGFRRRSIGDLQQVGSLLDPWLRNFNTWIAERMGTRLSTFEGDPLTLPTLILLSAYRDIVPIKQSELRAISEPADWNYRTIHSFQIEGGSWRESLDNLLVWLKWLDDGRFERAVSLINTRVFSGDTKFLKGVKKDPPEAVIVSDDQEHRLDKLSSGEKSLVQMFLRIGTHMTKNTILLIDEVDVHLHPAWRERTLGQLKAMIAEFFPGLTVIATTHSMEIMAGFAHDVPEPNLRKGVRVLETEEEELRAHEVSKGSE